MARSRILEILLGLPRRKLRKDLRAARRDVQKFGQDTSTRLRTSFKDAFSTVAGVGSVAGVAAIGKDVLDVDRKLTRLGIQAGKSKEEMNAFHGSLRDLSDESGLGTGQLADAAAKFVSLTGNFEQAKRGAEVFAKASQASGASLEDVAAAAASLSNNLGITDIEGFEKGLSILLTQGKEGAVELREMAGLLPSIAPSFTKFGKSGTEGLAELGAALQVIRQGFGSGSEAATGLNALMTSLARNAGKFEDAGVKLFTTDENGVQHFRQLSAIIEDIGNSKLMKSETALIDAFGSSEAARAFSEVHKNFRGAGGKNGFMELWKKSMDSKAVQDDYAAYMESRAGRMDKAWQRLQNTLARELTPERIDDLVEAFELLGRGVAWVVRNIKALVMTFGALKLAQWSMRLYSLASAMGSAGGGAEKLAGAGDRLGGPGQAGIGKFARTLGALGAIPGVFALGYQLGDLLSKALGLQDALDKVHDITPTESLGQYDPDKKAALHMNASQNYMERAAKVQRELDEDRIIQDNPRMAVMGIEAMSDAERAEKEALVRGLQKRATEEKRRAVAAQIIERVNQSGTVDLRKSMMIGGTFDKDTMRALATAAVQQTGQDASNPELLATMNRVVIELQKLNGREVDIENRGAALAAAMRNDVGRSPAP